MSQVLTPSLYKPHQVGHFTATHVNINLFSTTRYNSKTTHRLSVKLPLWIQTVYEFRSIRPLPIAPHLCLAPLRPSLRLTPQPTYSTLNSKVMNRCLCLTHFERSLVSLAEGLETFLFLVSSWRRILWYRRKKGPKRRWNRASSKKRTGFPCQN